MVSAWRPESRFAGVHSGALNFDGHFVVMRYSGTENGHPVSQIDLYGWDADNKRYTFDSFNSLGQRANFTGSVSGDTWNWSMERMAGGTRLFTSMLQHFTADGRLTWKIETSAGAAHRAVAVTGQAKRAA